MLIYLEIPQYRMILKRFYDIPGFYFVGTGKLFSSVDTNRTGPADGSTTSSRKCQRGILCLFNVAQGIEKRDLSGRQSIELMGIGLRTKDRYLHASSFSY
jgi:hypothetical protein